MVEHKQRYYARKASKGYVPLRYGPSAIISDSSLDPRLNASHARGNRKAYVRKGATEQQLALLNKANATRLNRLEEVRPQANEFGYVPWWVNMSADQYEKLYHNRPIQLSHDDIFGGLGRQFHHNHNVELHLTINQALRFKTAEDKGKGVRLTFTKKQHRYHEGRGFWDKIKHAFSKAAHWVAHTAAPAVYHVGKEIVSKAGHEALQAARPLVKTALNTATMGINNSALRGVAQAAINHSGLGLHHHRKRGRPRKYDYEGGSFAPAGY